MVKVCSNTPRPKPVPLTGVAENVHIFNPVPSFENIKKHKNPAGTLFQNISSFIINNQFSSDSMTRDRNPTLTEWGILLHSCLVKCHFTDQVLGFFNQKPTKFLANSKDNENYFLVFVFIVEPMQT